MSILWGASISAGVVASDLDAFETLAGKKMSMLGIGTWWYSGTYPNGSYNSFPTTKANLIHGRGGYLLLDWSPGPSSGNDVNFNNRSIYLNHVHDAYIDSFADAIKALGFGIMIRPFHEMNGSWYPTWWEGSSYNLGKGSGDLANAYRYVVDRFRARGCNNVAWVFNPNIMSATAGSSTNQPLSQLYPGDAYVDWKALDGYNEGNGSPWQELSEVMQGGGTTGLLNSIQNIINVGDPKIPIMIAETGCNQTDETGAVNGPKKATWFTNAFNTFLPAHPEIQAFVYSHYNEGTGWWRIDYPTTSSPAPSFAAPSGIASAHYLAGGSFTLDPTNPLPPYWLGTPTDHYRTMVKSVSGLAGYWRGQDASGNLVDDSGNGHTATAEGTPSYAVASAVVPANTTDKALGLAGDALTGFRLLDANVWSPVTTGSMSWSAAFILDAYPATGTNAYFFGKGNGTGAQYEYDIYVSATGLLNFALRQLTSDLSTNVISTLTVPLGVPCLLQARYDGSTRLMQLVASSAAPGANWGNVCNKTATWSYTLSNGTADLLLLRRDRSTDHTINGKAAHLFISTVALTDVTWQELYNAWIAAPVISGVSVA